METATTLRDEIRQLLASSTEPLARPEIFDKCKFAGNEATLSTVLSQLCNDGSIKKVGERERIGGRALALYGVGGGAVKAKKPRAAKPAKPAKRKKIRTKPLRKVQRRNARSPERHARDLAADFRCGLFSDGSMELQHAGEFFKMDEHEVRVLFGYLEKTLTEARA